jgi:hypothetical protein
MIPTLPANAEFSCSAGDFVEIYGPQTGMSVFTIHWVLNLTNF